MMSSLTGIAAVMGALKKLEKKYGTDPKPEIIIGFAQTYAIYVHENLEAHHPIGNAKYLEIPRWRSSLKSRWQLEFCFHGRG